MTNLRDDPERTARKIAEHFRSLPREMDVETCFMRLREEIAAAIRERDSEIRHLKDATPRDGVTVADDDGTTIVFDVVIAMHVKAAPDAGVRSWQRTSLYCGRSQVAGRIATHIGGPPQIEGDLAGLLVGAIEGYLSDHQPETAGREP